MTDELDLTAIEARCEAAMPGPWAYWPEHEEVYTTQGCQTSDERDIAYLNPNSSHDMVADCVFIAHARADLPALLALVDRLTARVGELEADAELGRLVRTVLPSEAGCDGSAALSYRGHLVALFGAEAAWGLIWADGDNGPLDFDTTDEGGSPTELLGRHAPPKVAPCQ